MLRKLFAQFASSEPTTTRMRPVKSPSASAAALVDGVSNVAGSQTASEPRSAWTDSAARSAFLRALRLTLTVYERGDGPNATPPPYRFGVRERAGAGAAGALLAERLGAWSSRPRRACGRGVPWRRASARRGRSRGRGPCGTPRRIPSRRGRPCRPCRCREPLLRHQSVRPDLDDGALGAGDGAAQHQQVRVGVHLDDLEAALRDALVAHLAGPAHALEHARRRRGRRSIPARARCASRGVTGPRLKRWRLTVPWKPLPFERPRP